VGTPANWNSPLLSLVTVWRQSAPFAWSVTVAPGTGR
jgi:hypothetical protein